MLADIPADKLDEFAKFPVKKVNKKSMCQLIPVCFRC